MWSISIHGGAGKIARTRDVSTDVEELREALRRAVAVVKRETPGVARRLSPDAPTALAAAIEAVVAMEDSIRFNAGRGSCLNTSGKCEMEAAVMVGTTLSSGACCGLTLTKNPILLAEHVRVNTPHTMIGFGSADEMAQVAGLEMKDPDWFIVDRRARQQYRAAMTESKPMLDHDMDDTTTTTGDTVGAVVLDIDGVLAGAVSTGGKTNKYAGRIGDSPCIGSGLYVSPEAAVCGSGEGEAFVASSSCAQICHAMKYGHLTLEEAISRVLEAMPEETGGIIGIDAQGTIVSKITSLGMYRASADSTGAESVVIWD